MSPIHTAPGLLLPQADKSWLTKYASNGRSLSAAMALVVLAALLATLLPACGGGVGTGGTGSYAEGTITGFGSVIVNGVRFDESAARIEDDDGAAQSSAALRLGMTVQIDAGPLSSSGTDTVAQAHLLRVTRALVGPVAGLNLPGGRFSVLGQPVEVGVDTVFDERLPNALAGLAGGTRVEVYAVFDALSGSYHASRVALAASGAANKVAGPVTQIDTSARTLRIGGQSYSFAALGTLAGLAEGALLRLGLPGTTDAKGRWIIAGQSAADPLPAEAAQLELRGLVQAQSSATRFTVEGRPVDTASARIDGVITPGAQVKVSGVLRAGVVQASRVTVENSGSPQELEVGGPITAVELANRRFVVRNTSISYARADVEFSGGTAAQLAQGRKVTVKGQLSADRSVLDALKIKFEN